MGLKGLARAMSIRLSPKIKPGAGRVVLMTVTHMDQGVMEIEFAGLKKALEPTASHPLFSEDRNDWVPAGQLRVGERIRTKTGTARIEAIRWKKGEHRVYNIEVEADHAYFVSEIELLSHNANPCKVVTVSASKHPEAAKHVADAQKAGHPSVITIDRSGTTANRRASLKGQQKVKNKDLDEYPPAVSQEGGAGASVRAISRRDNRGAGSSFGHQVRKVKDGEQVEVKVVP
jgi:hypothetical protein